MQTPVIRKKEVTRPVFTETIQNQAIVDNEEIVNKVPVEIPGQVTYREKYIQPVKNVQQQLINVQQQETQKFEYPEKTNPIEYSEEIIVKNFTAPQREVLYQPIVEKKIINRKEELEFIPESEQVINLSPVNRKAYVREQERVETVQRPGKTTVKETYLQPIVNREKVELRVKQSEDKQVQLDPLTAESEIFNIKKLQTIAVPGKETITQPVV